MMWMSRSTARFSKTISVLARTLLAITGLAHFAASWRVPANNRIRVASTNEVETVHSTLW
jgi:hypothetical protein